MTAQKELGPIKKRYLGRTITWVDFFLWVMPGALLPVILVFYGAYMRTFGYAQSGIRPEMWFALAAVAFTPFAIILFRRIISARKSIIVHENGLRLTNINQKHQTLLWCQLSAIRTESTRYHFLGLPINIFTVYVEPVHGQEIQIGDYIKDLPDLSEQIKSKIYPLLLPSMTAELAQGQTLTFGSIMFNPEQITIKKKTLPWASVKAINIDAGSLILTNRRNKNTKLPIGSIANVELFLQIVNKQLFPQ